MYIGVAGVHSSGKTSFLNEVKCEIDCAGYKSKIIESLPKEARNKGFPILRDLTFESTLWMISTCTSRELEESLKYDVILIDRAVPDALGYYLAAMENSQRVIDPVEREYLEKITSCHSKKYDFLFKTIIDNSMPIDGSRDRDMDIKYRNLIDNSLKDVFNMSVEKWFPLSIDNRQECSKMCVDAVKERLNKSI